MQNLYSIKDKKIGFNSPFTAPNNYAAIRMFADTVKDENSMLAKHPEDYELYKLGSFNDDTGEIVADCQYLENAMNF